MEDFLILGLFEFIGNLLAYEANAIQNAGLNHMS